MIKKVETKEEAFICNNLLSKLIKDEAKYNDNIKTDFVIDDWYQNLYDKDGNVIYIAIEDDKIVGYIYIKILKKDGIMIYDEAMIDALYVESEYRNRKIATKLIEKAKEWCNENDIHIITLNVIFKNEVAKKLYKNFGFEEFSLNLKCKL